MPYYGGHSPSGQMNNDIIFDSFYKGRANVPQVIDASSLLEGMSPYMFNIDTSGGGVRTMSGFTSVVTSPTAGDISNIHYDAYTGFTYVSYADRVGKISGSTIDPLTGATGFTANSTHLFCRVGTYLFMVNGEDAPRKWNEATSSLSVITTPPASWTSGNYPKACRNWNRRAFAFGMQGETDILHYSVLDDVDDWTPGTAASDGGAIVVGNDGVPIKCIIPLAKGLLILKDPGLYVLLGSHDDEGNFDQTTFDWDLIDSEVDCVGARAAAAAANNKVYAWGRTNVWEISGTDRIEGITAREISKFISHDVGRSVGYEDQVCAIHYADRGQMWFAVPDGVSSLGIDTVQVYDYRNQFKDPQSQDYYGQWMLRNGYRHKCMSIVRDANGEAQIYSGDYSDVDGDPSIYHQNVGRSYGGEEIDYAYHTDWREFAGVPVGRTPIVIITLGPESVGDVDYSYGYDYDPAPVDTIQLTASSPGSSWNTTGESYYNSGPSGGEWLSGVSREFKELIYSHGRRIQHRFHATGTNINFAILEIKHPSITIGNR